MRASRSRLPSPLQSPGASSAVKPPQPLPIGSPPPGTNVARARAAVHQQPAAGVDGEHVGLVSPFQSRRRGRGANADAQRRGDEER